MCKIPENAHVYLIMSGSMGFGKIQLFVAELLRRIQPDEYIIVICGANKKLYHILTGEFGRSANVRIVGYTEHIAAYMDACDVLYTKPGGLTSTEAAVKGIPIVHTTPIPGCETRNREFFSVRGLSVTSDKFYGQIAAGQSLLRAPTAVKPCVPPSQQQSRGTRHSKPTDSCAVSAENPEVKYNVLPIYPAGLLIRQHPIRPTDSQAVKRNRHQRGRQRPQSWSL